MRLPGCSRWKGREARPKLRARLLFAAAVLAGEQGDYSFGPATVRRESGDLSRTQRQSRGRGRTKRAGRQRSRSWRTGRGILTVRALCGDMEGPWRFRRHRPRAQQPRQRDEVAGRICARVLALRRVPDDVPKSRRWRWSRLDIELPGRRRARKSGLGRGPLILRTESGGVPPTAGRLGNCKRPLRFGKSKLRSGEQRRSAPSLRGKHPDVSGVGSQTRDRASARMSGCKCRGAIERRAIAASGRSRSRTSPTIGRTAYADRTTRDWRRHWNSRAERWAMLQALTAWMEGWAMPVEQAVREALDGNAGTRSSSMKLRLNQFAVLGSIMRRTAETRFAGKPPRRACSRTVSSSGARYTQ